MPRSIRAVLHASLLSALLACGPRSIEVIVRTPAPPVEISVIETGGSDPTQWPACFGASGYGCISRINASCEEVEIAYTFTHMSEVHLDPFTARSGDMVDQEGNSLSPEDIVQIARDEGRELEEGPALAGDRFYLVGEHTERGEIDVFHSGHVELDYVRCVDEESTFTVEHA